MKVVGRFIDEVGSSSKWGQMDAVAEAFETADEIALGATAGEAVEVGIPEILIGSAKLQHVIDDDQEFAGHRYRGTAKTTPRLEPTSSMKRPTTFMAG